MAIFNIKTIKKWKEGYTIITKYLYSIPVKSHAYRDDSEQYEALPQGAKTPWADKWLLCAGDLQPQQVSSTDYSYIQLKHFEDKGMLFDTWDNAMKAMNDALSAIHSKP